MPQWLGWIAVVVLSLYLAVFPPDGAAAVEPIEPLNSPWDERDPAITLDGLALAFASNRAGSEGGFDVYRSVKERGEWLPPEPIPGINTAADERSPRPSRDGFSMMLAIGDERSGTASDLHRARSLVYPPEYLVTVAPAAPPAGPPVHFSQPPSTVTPVWFGDSARAAELVTYAYAERGRPITMVSDSGRVIYRADGLWRIYDVTWRDGYRRQVAVHMRASRDYYAIEADDGENWSAAVYLGR